MRLGAALLYRCPCVPQLGDAIAPALGQCNHGRQNPKTGVRSSRCPLLIDRHIGAVVTPHPAACPYTTTFLPVGISTRRAPPSRRALQVSTARSLLAPFATANSTTGLARLADQDLTPSTMTVAPGASRMPSGR